MFTTKPWNCPMDILPQCLMLGNKVRSLSICTRFSLRIFDSYPSASSRSRLILASWFP
ncbi:hypothetical protein Ddye_024075, partial [Dipteronia dyeriana]